MNLHDDFMRLSFGDWLAAFFDGFIASSLGGQAEDLLVGHRVDLVRVGRSALMFNDFVRSVAKR